MTSSTVTSVNQIFMSQLQAAGLSPSKIANFTQLAQQQGFHPRYVLDDTGIVSITNGTSDGVNSATFKGGSRDDDPSEFKPPF